MSGSPSNRSDRSSPPRSASRSCSPDDHVRDKMQGKTQNVKPKKERDYNYVWYQLPPRTEYYMTPAIDHDYPPPPPADQQYYPDDPYCPEYVQVPVPVPVPVATRRHSWGHIDDKLRGAAVRSKKSKWLTIKIREQEGPKSRPKSEQRSRNRSRSRAQDGEEEATVYYPTYYDNVWSDEYVKSSSSNVKRLYCCPYHPHHHQGPEAKYYGYYYPTAQNENRGDDEDGRYYYDYHRHGMPEPGLPVDTNKPQPLADLGYRVSYSDTRRRAVPSPYYPSGAGAGGAEYYHHHDPYGYGAAGCAPGYYSETFCDYRSGPDGSRHHWWTQSA